jgi:hypothetical protein
MLTCPMWILMDFGPNRQIRHECDKLRTFYILRSTGNIDDKL